MLEFKQTTFGGIVSLVTPSASLFQSPIEFVAEREVVQSNNSDPGLIQAGIYRSGGGLQLNIGCAPPDGYFIYTEVKSANSPGYRCQILTPSVSPGTVVTLDIFRFPAPETWGIRVNGVTTGSTFATGFNKGRPAVGTEIQTASTMNSYQSRTSTRFDPPGAARWAVYPGVGRLHPRRVSARDHPRAYPMADHFWKLTRPPAAITVRHRSP